MRSTLTRVATLSLLLSVVACGNSGNSGTEAIKGNALRDPSPGGVAGNDHAKVGQAWWAALPLTQNVSSKPLELLDAQVLDLPKGLKISRYAAFNSEETNGVGLLFPDGSSDFPVSKYKDYSKSPIKLDPQKDGYFYYSVRLIVTGEVSGESSVCRYTYRQDGVKYMQDLPCRFTLKLEQSG